MVNTEHRQGRVHEDLPFCQEADQRPRQRVAQGQVGPMVRLLSRAGRDDEAMPGVTRFQ